jgi:hypothetical protein
MSLSWWGVQIVSLLGALTVQPKRVMTDHVAALFEGVP